MGLYESAKDNKPADHKYVPRDSMHWNTVGLSCKRIGICDACNRSAATIRMRDGYQHVQTQRAGTTYSKLTLLPVQLEIRTPFEPTAFQSGGRNYLFYELHFRNFTRDPLTLRSIQVINAENTTQELIAEFIDKKLDALLLPIGVGKADDKNKLGAGQSLVALLCIAFDGQTRVPSKVRHIVLLDDAVAEGPIIGTHRTKLLILGRPLVGTDWNAGFCTKHQFSPPSRSFGCWWSRTNCPSLRD